VTMYEGWISFLTCEEKLMSTAFRVLKFVTTVFQVFRHDKNRYDFSEIDCDKYDLLRKIMWVFECKNFTTNLRCCKKVRNFYTLFLVRVSLGRWRISVIAVIICFLLACYAAGCIACILLHQCSSVTFTLSRRSASVF